MIQRKGRIAAASGEVRGLSGEHAQFENEDGILIKGTVHAEYMPQYYQVRCFFYTETLRLRSRCCCKQSYAPSLIFMKSSI